MTAADPCPCGLGFLERLLGTAGWLRCPQCNRSFDNHGHAYDAQWRPVSDTYPGHATLI